MVSTSTFKSDTVKFVRNLLDDNLTDPIASSRSERDRFVMTSYPERSVQYPIITVRCPGITGIQRMGMQSELYYMNVPLEIRAWCRNEKERDNFEENIINELRTNQFGVASSVGAEDLHGLSFDSSVPNDEVGKGGIQSQIIQITYTFVVGQ